MFRAKWRTCSPSLPHRGAHDDHRGRSALMGNAALCTSRDDDCSTCHICADSPRAHRLTSERGGAPCPHRVARDDARSEMDGRTEAALASFFALTPLGCTRTERDELGDLHAHNKTALASLLSRHGSRLQHGHGLTQAAQGEYDRECGSTP